MKKLVLILLPSLLLGACNAGQLNTKFETQQLQSKNDSLKRIIDSLGQKNPESPINASIPPKPVEEFVYAIIHYTIPREKLVEGKTIKGYGDREDIVIPDSYILENVPYLYISPIRQLQWQSMVLDEDLKYRFLDEMETTLRNNNPINKVNIVSREVKIFSTYAEASKSIESLKLSLNGSVN